MKDARKKIIPNQSFSVRPELKDESFRDVRRRLHKNLLEERRKANLPKKTLTPGPSPTRGEGSKEKGMQRQGEGETSLGLILVFLVVGGAVVLGLIIWLASERYPESTEEFVTVPRVTKPAPFTPPPTPALPVDGEGASQSPATPSDKGESKASPTFPNAPNTTPPISLEALVQKLKPAVVFIRVYYGGGKGGEGTGFFISSQGFLLTCAHVVESAQRLRVRTADGQETDATVVWRDYARDLALVKIPISGGGASLASEAKQPSQPVIPLAEAQVKEGHPIIVVGYPLGSSLGREPTVTSGILSAIRRRNGLEALQISAPINPGNSGGPLVSAQTGKALGVVNAKISSASDIEGRNESSSRIEGIGFAVPITRELRETLEKVLR